MTTDQAPARDDVGLALRRVIEHLAAVDVTAVHPIHRQRIIQAADALTMVLAAGRRSGRGRRGTRRGAGVRSDALPTGGDAA